MSEPGHQQSLKKEKVNPQNAIIICSTSQGYVHTAIFTQDLQNA